MRGESADGLFTDLQAVLLHINAAMPTADVMRDENLVTSVVLLSN